MEEQSVATPLFEEQATTAEMFETGVRPACAPWLSLLACDRQTVSAYVDSPSLPSYGYRRIVIDPFNYVNIHCTLFGEHPGDPYVVERGKKIIPDHIKFGLHVAGVSGIDAD